MDLAIIIAATLAIAGYTIGSVKIINQGTEAIVERLGKYQRTLKPGLNFVIPMMDAILVESIRERFIDIAPQSAMTRDNATVDVDAIVYWQILDLYSAYYNVENLKAALENLVITSLRSEVGRMNLSDLVSSRDKINEGVLRHLDEATESWGVKIMRVEVQEIKISDELRQARDRELAAESLKKAALSQSEADVKSIQIIAEALANTPNSRAMLQYLVAKNFIDANQKLSASPNSKIIFLDPKALTETVGELIAADQTEGLSGTSNGDIKPGG
jgi:regulator of protease activity HflC (stomatin/prohibitin superfamily)